MCICARKFYTIVWLELNCILYGCAARIKLYKLSKRLDLSVGSSFIFVRRVQKRLCDVDLSLV